MKAISFTLSPLRLANAIASVAVVFALAFVMRLIGPGILGEGVIALLYLIPIGWCTVRWGQIAGVSAAITAALSFDFLFIPPYNSFSIGSIQGWLLLILFIAVSILVVGRILTILADERNRERKATFLYEMVSAIANQVQQKYLAERVQVQLSGSENLPPMDISAINNPVESINRRPDRVLPIQSGPALIGEIAIWKGLLPLPAEDDLMLQTLLRQTAAALERAQTAVEGGFSAAGL